MKKLACLLAALMVASFTACSGGTPPASSGADASTPTSANADSAQDGASSTDGKKSHEGETLVVGVWGGTIEAALRASVVEPLEQETGCKVELVLGGTGDRRAKLYAEKGNPSMDVAFLNIFESKQAIDAGVAQPVDTTLSNFDQLYPLAQEGGYGMSIMGLGIVYNKDLVTEPVNSWKDLWRPEFKGKIAFPVYPGFEGDGMISATAMAFGYDVKTDIDKVFAKLTELKPVPMFYNSLDELFLELKQGNVLAAPLFNSYANDYIEKGFPVAFSYPTDPGPILAKDTIVIAQGTKHEELAKKFVDRCIGVEAQTYYAENIFFAPCNKEVKVSEDVAKRLVYGEDVVEKLVTLDWDYILTQQDTWTEKWNREIAAN